MWTAAGGAARRFSPSRAAGFGETRCMFVAWTTVPARKDADRLARGAVELRLAACAQIDGAIVSHYWWEGRPDSAKEYRVWFKCVASQLPELEKWVLAHHPYDTPQWLAVRADAVAEKYLSWAQATSTSAPFTKPKTS
jgi:periplasmic divalent cation tolerance protein